VSVFTGSKQIQMRSITGPFEASSSLRTSTKETDHGS
jgi:hypothetical protein